MAARDGYVTGWPGVNGDHVIEDRPGLLGNMRVRAVCGEMTVTVTIFGCSKQEWLPAYGGCVNCLAALRRDR